MPTTTKTRPQVVRGVRLERGVRRVQDRRLVGEEGPVDQQQADRHHPEGDPGERGRVHRPLEAVSHGKVRKPAMKNVVKTRALKTPCMERPW